MEGAPDGMADHCGSRAVRDGVRSLAQAERPFHPAGRAALGACRRPAERQLGPCREAGPLMSLAPAQTGPVEVTPPVGLSSRAAAERRSHGLAAGGAERPSPPAAE